MLIHRALFLVAVAVSVAIAYFAAAGQTTVFWLLVGVLPICLLTIFEFIHQRISSALVTAYEVRTRAIAENGNCAHCDSLSTLLQEVMDNNLLTNRQKDKLAKLIRKTRDGGCETTARPA